MGSFDREQLETWKRQIEDDYRLDMAAIERLIRRCVPSNTGIAAVKEAPAADRAPALERAPERAPERGPDRNVTVLPTLEPQAEAQPDDLTNTLRGMFSGHRR